MASNEAFVLNTTGDGEGVMKLQPFPMPAAGDHDCLVEMRQIGICGSDVHYWKHGRIGDAFVCKEPMVLGHESSGVIVHVGKAVTGLQKGDRVALEPGVPCGSCVQCGEGKYNLCPDMRFFATPSPAGNPGHGSLARWVSHPAKWCFKLPDNVSLEGGAFCEPLSVGVYACEQKVKVKQGSSLVIFGAGPIGTLCSLVAKGMGASPLMLIDIAAPRLAFVSGLIPGLITINSAGKSPEQVAEEIKAANGGKLVDGCIDCCGVESAIQAAIKGTRSGGVVCLVGMGKPQVTLPLLEASIREVNLEGVFRYRNTYPRCLELLSQGKIDLGPLLTHRFEFKQESMQEAFDTCNAGQSADGTTAIKCMIGIEPSAKRFKAGL